MLPGYAIEPKKLVGKRGAPFRHADYDPQEMLFQFSDLMGELQKIDESDPAALGRKRGESSSDFVQRLVEVIQRLYQKSTGHHLDYSIQELDRKEGRSSDGRTMMDVMAKISGRRLDKHITLSIARLACGKKQAHKRKIVYSLLALYFFPSTKKAHRRWQIIRGLIERAESDWPRLQFKSISSQSFLQ